MKQTNEKDFMKLSHSDKEQIVVDKGGCTRCLGWNHTQPACSAYIRCSTCNGKHATAMHNPNWIKKKSIVSAPQVHPTTLST